MNDIKKSPIGTLGYDFIEARYLPKGKEQPFVVDANYKQPNGIVGTPDGKYLYVADIGDRYP